MTPTLPIPTDNIYKFACLFGLALIVTSIFSFVATYSATLDRKVKYSEVIIPLEGKAPRTKAEDEILDMNKRLIEVAQENQKFASTVIGFVLTFGIVIAVSGAILWYKKIQVRDDKLARLQIEKLELELASLRKGFIPQKGGKKPEAVSATADR